MARLSTTNGTDRESCFMAMIASTKDSGLATTKTGEDMRSNPMAASIKATLSTGNQKE